MSFSATINQNGQIVIPAKIRKKYGLNPQQNIQIIQKENSLELVPVKEGNIYPFKKHKKSRIFSFTPKNPQEILSQQVDSILYS